MQNNCNRLPAIIAGLGLVLFLQACHNDDPCFPNCPPKPSCDAQSHLTYAPPPAVKPEPHQFIKTYGPDGRINYMDAYPTSLWGVIRFKGFVGYAGNQVFMLDSLSRDTLLKARLDDCGRPLSSTTLVAEDLHYDRYIYDSKGRLSKVVHIRPGSSDSSTVTYTYDQYNNVKRIGTPSLGLDYEYDYSRPVKGAYYETGVFNFPTFGPRLLEFLGYLDTQPNHLLVKFTNNYEYPYHTLEFRNQTVNAQGYVTSYEAFENNFSSFKGTLNWNCGGPKY